jgi:hypothetical protein
MVTKRELKKRLERTQAAQETARKSRTRAEQEYRTASAAYQRAWLNYSRLDRVTPKRARDRLALDDARSDLRAAESARDRANETLKHTKGQVSSRGASVARAERDLRAVDDDD